MGLESHKGERKLSHCFQTCKSFSLSLPLQQPKQLEEAALITGRIGKRGRYRQWLSGWNLLALSRGEVWLRPVRFRVQGLALGSGCQRKHGVK